VGNRIASKSSPGAASLKMSNGLTAVFLDVLVLTGMDAAKDPWERGLVYWLAQHDQSRCGVGSVGFDIAQMGWTEAGFDREKGFVFAMIDAALQRHGWDRLPFVPDEDWLFPTLLHFRRLVECFPATAIGSSPPTEWEPGEVPTFGSCEVHRVFLHETGCIICNDAPIGAPAADAPHRSPGE
jgi:hypothetical protein